MAASKGKQQEYPGTSTLYSATVFIKASQLQAARKKTHFLSQHVLIAAAAAAHGLLSSIVIPLAVHNPSSAATAAARMANLYTANS